MSAAVSYERVRDQLATLGLEAALTSLDPVLARGQQDQKVAVEVLDELLGGELAARFERRISTNRKLSGLPTGLLIDLANQVRNDGLHALSGLEAPNIVRGKAKALKGRRR